MHIDEHFKQTMLSNGNEPDLIFEQISIRSPVTYNIYEHDSYKDSKNKYMICRKSKSSTHTGIYHMAVQSSSYDT